MQVKDRSSSVIAIRAAVLREPGRPLRIEELEMEGPREDEVLVRLVASGICHTDIDFCDSGGVGPAVLGHEGAGVVEWLGRSVKGVQVGDHVVLSYQSCGQCGACRGHHPADCQRFHEANFGFQRLDGSNALESSGVHGHFFGQSSFATHTLATVRNLVKVPRTLPLELLTPLGCGLQTGAGTVMNSLAVKAGSSLAVFGAGTVGLAAVMAARIVGARTIIAVDIKPLHLKLALQLGATHTIDNRRGDLAQSLSDITGGGVDYVVETTGDAQLHSLAVDLLNPCGKLALLTGGSGTDLPGGRQVLSVIQGDAVPQRFIPKLIRLYEQGRFPFDRLIRYYPFRQIKRAIADSKRGATIKPVLRICPEIQ
jgi:aryl-alcohol dehydrogenase